MPSGSARRNSRRVSHAVVLPWRYPRLRASRKATGLLEMPHRELFVEPSLPSRRAIGQGSCANWSRVRLHRSRAAGDRNRRPPIGRSCSLRRSGIAAPAGSAQGIEAADQPNRVTAVDVHSEVRLFQPRWRQCLGIGSWYGDRAVGDALMRRPPGFQELALVLGQGCPLSGRRRP